jgi:transcriptional regulator with XRE-family HTH domain
MKGLKHVRRNAGITQRKLANDFYVAQSTISRWERGIACPKGYIIWDIAEYFGVTIGDILDSPNEKGGE